jgi:MFS family permease
MQESGVSQKVKKGVYYGWWVLSGTLVVNALGGGIHFYGFSVFFLPLRESLGISAASASLIFAFSRAEGAFEGPVVGYLIDRFGARFFIAAGAIVTGIGYLLLSTGQSYIAVLLIYTLVISVGFNAGFGHATLALVNNWFVRRRSLAMAMSTSAFAIGGAIVAPLLGLAVAEWGWRVAAILAGLAILTFVTPVSLFLRNSPESMGLGPDGDPPASGAATSSDGAEGAHGAGSNEFTLREAIRTPTFWLFVAATTLRIAVGGAFIVHFVPIFVWKGMGATAAAGLLGLFSFLSIPLRLGMGLIGDRFSKTMLITLTLVVGGASFLLLLYGHGLWYLWVFIPVYAWVESSPPLNWALLGDYFGRRSFATIRGAMSFFFGLGQMILPYLAGVMWDRTQSYSSVLWTFSVLWLLSAVLFILLRAPRKKA